MRTTCGSSLLSTAMSGVRERIIASRSCNGLSVFVTPDWFNLEDGKFIDFAGRQMAPPSLFLWI
jgi:hypothetical protein